MLELDKVYCMDCLEGIRRIEDKSIDMIIADPPYGINFQSAWRIESKRFNHIDNDDRIDGSWIKEVYRILKNDTATYVFTRWDVYPEWSLLLNQNFKIKSCIIWDRVIHGLGDLEGNYAPQYDMCLFGVKGNHKLKNGRPKDIIRCKRVNPNDLLHPAEKPVDLLKNFILNSSNVGDVVLDPFMGSGTTAVACKQLNRHFIGFEINQDYVDICNKRLANIPKRLDLFS